MVELAALTYSPISFKRSRRTLLGTPTSLARALTRIFDTSLLYSARIELRRTSYSRGELISECSSVAHRG